MGLIIIIIAPAGVMAASADDCIRDSSFLGLPTWYKHLEPNFIDGVCELNFDITKDIPKVLLAVFEIILRLGGVAAVVMVITGGVQYMISQGEPDKIKGARVTIINAIVGLVIAMMAVVIVNFIGGIV
jgi:hypothetical protein